MFDISGTPLSRLLPSRDVDAKFSDADINMLIWPSILTKHPMDGSFGKHSPFLLSTDAERLTCKKISYSSAILLCAKIPSLCSSCGCPEVRQNIINTTQGVQMNKTLFLRSSSCGSPSRSWLHGSMWEWCQVWTCKSTLTWLSFSHMGDNIFLHNFKRSTKQKGPAEKTSHFAKSHGLWCFYSSALKVHNAFHKNHLSGWLQQDHWSS